VSNLLATSVLRGFPQVGGAYPEGGACSTAKALVAYLRQQGSDAVTRLSVEEIVVEGGRAAGIRLQDGPVIRAREAVVSTVGYYNTRALVPESLRSLWPETFKNIGPSDGFVSVQIGLTEAFAFADASRGRQNLWYSAVDPDEGLQAGLESFLSAKSELPFGVLWCTKDPTHTGPISLQVLYCVPYAWFEAWAQQPSGSRAEDYQMLKQRWGQRAVAGLERFFPETKGFINLVDVSTPLTIEHYLKVSGTWMFAHQLMFAHHNHHVCV
jgi:all-trans-retinol 13,14-reductase